MLHLLFLLFLSSVTGFEIYLEGNFSTPCVVKYYGLNYFSAYIDSYSGHLSFHEVVLDYVTFPSPADSVIMVDHMPTITPEMEAAVSNLYLTPATLRCTFMITLTYNDMTAGYLMYADFLNASLLYAYGYFPSTTFDPFLNTYAYGRFQSRLPLSWTEGLPPAEVLLDLSACRYGDILYATNTTTVLPDCTILTCDAMFGLSLTPSCGWFSECNGDGKCVRNCSIVSSFVMDFFNGVREVTDRCRYHLLSSVRHHIYGQFKDRRRTKISFLDSLHLTVDTTSIDLLQGGIVLVNGSKSMQMPPGVEVTKDLTGVTVDIRGEMYIFFDGTGAFIMLAQSPMETVMTGMCVNNLQPNANFRIADDSCQTIVEEPPLTNIDCPMVQDQCSQMSPFVNDPSLAGLCPNLMCRYPDLDNLFCSFHYFYARKFKVPVLPECASSVCANHICAPHEFCGLNAAGDPMCFCRSVWAYTYRNNGIYSMNGEGPYCGDGEASLQLVSCLLEDKGVDVSQLRLLDPTCKGVIDNEAHTVNFYFNVSHDCKSEVSSNETHILYYNAILDNNTDSNGITREDQIYLDFSCAYEMPPPNVMTFRVHTSSMMIHLNTGLFSFSLETKACRDSQCLQPLSSEDELSLAEDIWIHLFASELATSQLVLSTEYCWVSDQQTDKGTRVHNLITNGCADPGDDTVKVLENGVGERCSYMFKAFQFVGYSGEVYMHCQVHLCVDDGTCAPVCPPPSGARRRRSVSSVWSTTFSSMSWANLDSSGSLKNK